MTWDGGLFIVILLALSPSYSLFSFTGSMPWTVTEWSQPSSVFSVRSKRRRVSFYFTPYCVLHSAQIVAVLRYSASFPDSPAPSYRYNGATHNCIDSIYCQVLNTHCVCVCVMCALVLYVPALYLQFLQPIFGYRPDFALTSWNYS